MEYDYKAEVYEQYLLRLLTPIESWVLVKDTQIPFEGEILIYMEDGKMIAWRYVINE